MAALKLTTSGVSNWCTISCNAGDHDNNDDDNDDNDNDSDYDNDDNDNKIDKDDLRELGLQP